MKYAVDQIIDQIVILEKIKTKEKKEEKKEKLPNTIKEGTILTYENSIYKIDRKEEQKRRERIQKKLEQLKK